MTPSAIVFMVVSVTSVVALVAWCYYRVLSTPPAESNREPGDDAE